MFSLSSKRIKKISLSSVMALVFLFVSSPASAAPNGGAIAILENPEWIFGAVGRGFAKDEEEANEFLTQGFEFESVRCISRKQSQEVIDEKSDPPQSYLVKSLQSRCQVKTLDGEIRERPFNDLLMTMLTQKEVTVIRIEDDNEFKFGGVILSLNRLHCNVNPQGPQQIICTYSPAQN